MYAYAAIQFFLWPPFFVLFIATLGILYVAGFSRPFKARLWKPHHWAVLSHLLFFAAAILIGILWPNPNLNRRLPNPAQGRASFALEVIFYASLASCGFWIWCMKGFRLFAAGLMMLMEMPTVTAIFIASMSVSGDWL